VRGRLIAFEGIDGCGKSTQAVLLSRAIDEPSLLTAEPGGTALGASLRKLLLDPTLPPISHDAEALLLCADRAQHVSQVLLPAIETGTWVVSDRYSASTLAYQGYGRGIDLARLKELISFATNGLEADLNVLVDVPVEVARSRRSEESADRLESLDGDFHERVFEGYHSLVAAEPGRWVVVDGTPSPEEVAAEVVGLVRRRLGGSPGGV
jgi:dTMP kinase